MKSNLNSLYKNRFESTGINFRNEMWKILCMNFFQTYIKQTDVVIDMACGYGEFINNIKAKKKIAIDLNKDAVKYLNKGILFLYASSDKIPINNNFADKVFISNFFEHLTRDQITKTVLELKRVLKKNGQVIILQPNVRFCAKDYWMFFDHITPVDDRALDEVFLMNNFRLAKKINKFLPYTTKSKLPKNNLLIKLYLKIPILWKIFGKQSLIIYQNN